MKILRHAMMMMALILFCTSAMAAPGRKVMLENFLEGPSTPRNIREMVTFIEANLPTVQVIHDHLYESFKTPEIQVKMIKLLDKVFDMELAHLPLSQVVPKNHTSERLIQLWLVEVLSDSKFDITVREAAAEALKIQPALIHIEKDKRLIDRLARMLVTLGTGSGGEQKLYFDIAVTLGKVAGCELDLATGLRGVWGGGGDAAAGEKL